MKSEFWTSRTARLCAFSLALRLIVLRPRQASCFSTSSSMSRMSTGMERSLAGRAFAVGAGDRRRARSGAFHAARAQLRRDRVEDLGLLVGDAVTQAEEPPEPAARCLGDAPARRDQPADALVALRRRQ